MARLISTTRDDSYVTVQEAAQYFAGRADSSAWESATGSQKVKALISATSILEQRSYVGYTTKETQDLVWPRTGVYYYDQYKGRLIRLVDSEIPYIVKHATFEQAYHILVNDNLTDRTGTIDEARVGSLQVQGINPPPLIPILVLDILRPVSLRTNGALPGGF